MKRIDGSDKVTGAKVYASDFRASDFQGWPETTYHARILRSSKEHLNKKFKGLADASQVKGVVRVVTAKDLGKANNGELINKYVGFAKQILLEEDSCPEYIGHPLALIIFNNWRHTKQEISYLAKFEKKNPLESLFSPEYGLDDTYKYLLEKGGDIKESVYETEEFDKVEISPEALQGTFYTVTNDPAFMELESGLAYLDKEKEEIHIVYGTQSTGKDINHIQKFLNNTNNKNVEIKYHTKNPGGGFGGRDLSSFTVYLTVCACYSDKPVRLAFDRDEQFLAGIKRHSSFVNFRLDADRITKKLTSLRAKGVFNGGGEKNLTLAVVGLAAFHAIGSYKFSDYQILIKGVPTDSGISGSMRGFGIPQVNFAIESLMDDMATQLSTDPIQFRLDNLINTGDRAVDGHIITDNLLIKELCERAKEQPLWKNRHSDKSRRDTDIIKYGLGFACCIEAYGTSSDAVPMQIEINKDGGVVVYTAAVDMGQGSGTSLAQEVKPFFGKVADHVEMGVHKKFALLPSEIDLDQDKLNNLNRVLSKTSSMSASMTAFFHVKTLLEACEVLVEFGFIPAIKQLTGIEEMSLGDLSWDNGTACMFNHRVSYLDIINEMFRLDSTYVTGVKVHTSFKSVFSHGTYQINNSNKKREVDALVLKRGEKSKWEHMRAKFEYDAPGDPALKGKKRSKYAASGHLTAIEVNVKNGAIKLVNQVSFLDPGKIVNEDLLRGQVEGGFVMGLGMALKENMPIDNEGYDGSVNFNKYRLIRARDFELDMLKNLEIIQDENPTERKGIAEATMTTVPAAIGNAIKHALGRRIYSVPFTKSKVLYLIKELH